jgi:hypothetical protein
MHEYPDVFKMKFRSSQDIALSVGADGPEQSMEVHVSTSELLDDRRSFANANVKSFSRKLG